MPGGAPIGGMPPKFGGIPNGGMPDQRTIRNKVLKEKIAHIHVHIQLCV